MIKEIMKIQFTCDMCDHSHTEERAAMNDSQCYRLPSGWGLLSYAQEGGGHYGLPHHYTRHHVCTGCLASCEEKVVPKDAFDVKLVKW